MAAKYSCHVALTGPLARYVENAVATGVYASAGEVVRAGLPYWSSVMKPDVQVC
jgi:Arc/MetJ-type ribon-helix-helix transcriptional regulator